MRWVESGRAIQEVYDFSRIGSGRVTSFSKFHGTGGVTLTRPDPQTMTRPVKNQRYGMGGCTQFVHGRSRTTIDPRIPTMPDGARRVFTNQADIACIKREAP